jgi:hypothetical protein
MIIQYPKSIKWTILVKNRKIEEIVTSKSFRSDVKNTLLGLEQNHYVIAKEIVTDSFLDEFEPFYKSIIGIKKNPKEYNVKEYINSSKLPGKYFAFTLRKDGLFFGALIFRENKNVLACVFKAFPYSLDFYYRSNLAAVIDYYGLDYAIKNNFVEYKLGKDRNVYGQNAEIGLARYKTSIGALPYLPKETEFGEIDEKEIFDVDTLIFYTEGGSILNKAILYSKLDQLEFKNKYSVFLKNPNYQIKTIQMQ